MILSRISLKVVYILTITCMVSGGCGTSGDIDKPKSLPNIILIFCDDLGYADIGCFGSTKHRTPKIDRIAKEGKRFTNFYVTSGVCTPSRASLLTGCYPRRLNMHEDTEQHWVLLPIAKRGLNPDETTIAEILKTQGYATACIGKWHLGDQPEFLPTQQGFDYYFGIPYSNDMGPNRYFPDQPPLPFVRNEEVVEAPVDQNSITHRYTEEIISFIRTNKHQPFFVYLAHTMPHVPIHVGDSFRGQSSNGIYGDAVEEIDWSTGKIVDILTELGIGGKTLLIFASDNGAQKNIGGSNAPFSGWKGTTFEGGMRVPCVMRWPGKIPAGTESDELCSTLDLLPTFATLAGTEPPQDRVIDGKNIWPLISGTGDEKTPHDAFYYYFRRQLQAVRSGKWKLHLPLEVEQIKWDQVIMEGPGKKMALYDLGKDLQENSNVALKHPEVVERLMQLAEIAMTDLGDSDRDGKNQRMAGMVTSPKPLVLKAR